MGMAGGMTDGYLTIQLEHTFLEGINKIKRDKVIRKYKEKPEDFAFFHLNKSKLLSMIKYNSVHWPSFSKEDTF